VHACWSPMESWFSDCKVTIVYSEPSSPTLRSPPIDLPLPLEKLGTNLLSSEIMHMFATSGVYIEMSQWPPPFMMIGRQGYVVALKICLSRG
jgi:hypothetical protein